MAKRTEYYKQLGEKIAEIRKKSNISQKRMAEMLDIHPALISKFENLGEKLPAERIHEMLDILGYELVIAEKKKPVNGINGVKERLRQLLQAADETLEELDNRLGARASAENHEEGYTGDHGFNHV